MENSKLRSRKRFAVVLRLARLSVIRMVGNARSYVSKMMNNPHFREPRPELKTVSLQADKLEKAWERARSRDMVATQVMYAEQDRMENLLTALGHYAEDIANDTDIAEEVIRSAGMEFKTVTPRKPRVFSVKQGPNTGTVLAVTASMGAGSSYVWQTRKKGTDEWITAAVSVVASHLFVSLDSGDVYEFRQQTIHRKTVQDWSNILELRVL